jgi:hypothetical protein
MTLLFIIGTPMALRAELSKQDRDTAKKMVSRTLYLRLDIPLKSVQGAFGVGPDAVLEVSPTGHDTAHKLSLGMMNSTIRLNYVFYPNYPVRFGKLTFKGDTVEVWAEGVKPNEYEIRIDFIEISSLDDFTKAFNQIFSNVQLQDEHPEWPAEARNAIAEHRLVVGMTKEQAFDVVGTPLDIKSEDVNGVKVETWRPRLSKGKMLGQRHEEMGDTGFPALLKFVDGKLQVIG